LFAGNPLLGQEIIVLSYLHEPAMYLISDDESCSENGNFNPDCLQGIEKYVFDAVSKVYGFTYKVTMLINDTAI